MVTKAAFITGGSRGIGRGIAQVLAREGYDIAFTYHTEESEAASLKKEIESLGRRCFYYQASLEEADVPERITKQAIEDLGRLDALVCNAGLTKHNLVRYTQRELIDFVYGLNYRSYLLCTKAAANYMIEHNIHGSMVYITSTHGFRAYKYDCLYGSFKTALHRSCESIAMQLAPYGIRVNCVAPGATAVRGEYTEEALQAGFGAKIPWGRKGTPTEIANVVSFLLSDKASYVTGVAVKADGGLVLPGMPEISEGYGWDGTEMMLKRGWDPQKPFVNK